MLLTLAVALLAATAGCGGGPQFTQEQAAALISAQWPEAEVQMRNAYINEEGRGVALAQFDGEPWEFYFAPTEEDGWNLDAVSVDGGFYYLRDLEQISATMLQMGEAAGALEGYKAANDAYPSGDSPEALAVLVPDFLPEGTRPHDAWQQSFLYDSDGTDYTLISVGADGQSGTRDDIILHTGEFVGAAARGGRGQ
jgi:hypothetical protein